MRSAVAGTGTAAAPPQWLYLLFEHQSRPDRWMALRLLRYCCRIWETERRDHPEEQYLRPVLPLVFYQGEHHWRCATELAESFPPALRGQPWVPSFCPLLLDQTRVAPAAVAGTVRGQLLQLAMMHTFVPLLQQTPDLRAVTIFEELLRRHPELPPSVRRTLERRVRRWRAVHGPEQEVIFAQRQPP